MSWKVLSLAQLLSAQHIKHLENDLYEVRIRHTNPEYRLLGYIGGDTFYMVHVAPKKKNKLPRNVINTAASRIKSIKHHENI
jgi:phage-related protein